MVIGGDGIVLLVLVMVGRFIDMYVCIVQVHCTYIQG